MADRPILFSAPMVRAQWEGRKTQTRRILKPQPEISSNGTYHVFNAHGGYVGVPEVEVPATALDYVPYQTGDRLWVREAWSAPHEWTGTKPRDLPPGLPVWYWADGDPSEGDWTKPKPGIHMPRWMSRLTDTVAGVRVQRLREIDEEDARAEGAAAHPFPGPWWQGYREINGELLHQEAVGETPPSWMIEPKRMGSFKHLDRSARDAFTAIWSDINGALSWSANPWVIALTFTVERQNIGPKAEGLDEGAEQGRRTSDGGQNPAAVKEADQ